jgi:large subunit ribosomal protein L54
VVGDVTTPSAISSATPGISQPLSTPESVHIDVNPGATKPVVERPPSSCPAGTKLNGLNYFKNKPEVLAKEDHEYPDWLWDLLGDSSKSAKAEKGGVDPSSTLDYYYACPASPY